MQFEPSGRIFRIHFKLGLHFPVMLQQRVFPFRCYLPTQCPNSLTYSLNTNRTLHIIIVLCRSIILIFVVRKNRSSYHCIVFIQNVLYNWSTTTSSWRTRGIAISFCHWKAFQTCAWKSRQLDWFIRLFLPVRRIGLKL